MKEMSLTSKLFQHQHQHGPVLYFFLTLFLGLLILSNYLNYQPWLSQGDHGLNLYVAQAAIEGQRPYHDYHWFYGPLMPYYYGFFMKLFGTSIPSVLFGKFLLELATGLFIFGALSLVTSRYVSMIAALWFWTYTYDAFYTYNHAGGMVLSTGLIYVLFLYKQSPRLRYLYLGLFSTFLLSLVKINIGFSALAAFVLSVVILDRLSQRKLSPEKKYFYTNACVVLPVIVGLIHGILLYGLPFDEVKQCFQYFGNDASRAQYGSLFDNIKLLWVALTSNIEAKALVKFNLFAFKIFKVKPTAFWTNAFFWTIWIGTLATVICNFLNKKTETSIRNQYTSLLSILFIFYVLQLHEFLISGVLFRSYWGESFIVMFSFLIIGLAVHNYPKWVKISLCTLLLAIVLHKNIYHDYIIHSYKTPQHYLSVSKANIYAENSPAWFDTVTKATQYLKENLNRNELFFALPYDPLYYFLTDRLSPTRQLVFFEFLNISEEQERTIIADLERNNVNWILLSNRMNTPEPGVGYFGQTFCPMIAQYLRENFKTQAEFGDWTVPESGWFAPHAVRVLKRIVRKE